MTAFIANLHVQENQKPTREIIERFKAALLLHFCEPLLRKLVIKSNVFLAYARSVIPGEGRESNPHASIAR
jgi:hypothetical protein